MKKLMAITFVVLSISGATPIAAAPPNLRLIIQTIASLLPNGDHVGTNESGRPCKISVSHSPASATLRYDVNGYNLDDVDSNGTINGPYGKFALEDHPWSQLKKYKSSADGGFEAKSKKRSSMAFSWWSGRLKVNVLPGGSSLRVELDANDEDVICEIPKP